MTMCLAFAFSVFLHLLGSGSSGVQGAAGSTTSAAPKLPQILVFDLPRGLGSSGDRTAIRNFVLGYFYADEVEPRWVLDVAPELARIGEDGTARILLPLSDLPPGVYAARVKIRSASTESAWSAPSPPFSVPELRRRSPRRVRGAPKSQALNLGPLLLAAVKPLLPEDMDVADAARGFQNPVQFVSALLAARSVGIAFPELKATLLATPGRIGSLRSALATLRPDRDARVEARKALDQARRLVRETRGGLRPPLGDPPGRVSLLDG